MGVTSTVGMPLYVHYTVCLLLIGRRLGLPELAVAERTFSLASHLTDSAVYLVLCLASGQNTSLLSTAQLEKKEKGTQYLCASASI